ncbi:hypothetical protein NLX67_13365 [Domibacillus sp. A3M-37]|uniref:hypothetical protein n=1 Tax=Domibacillus sp. A3M-37 TaxID=2962037 RepID=UPI0020B7B43F|nr:hypothetical protein [Domibacillus sp. A3M-37]MCP3763371.1 hypothetical protein [Domibacillus sp. A3M-37]
MLGKTWLGASKRFVNELAKEIHKREKKQAKDKVTLYNELSHDLHTRIHFLRDAEGVMKTILSNVHSGEKDAELDKELHLKLGYYIEQNKKQVESLPVLRIPDQVSDLYFEAMDYYDAALKIIQLFMNKRAFNLYWEEIHELRGKLKREEISRDQFDRARKKLYIPEKAPKDKRELVQMRSDVFSQLMLLDDNTESILKLLSQ